MTMNFARFKAAGRWSDAASNPAGSRGPGTAEARFLSIVPRQSNRPRLVCTWQVDPVGGRPVAVWSTRP
jgi:hypothetical protein